MCIFSTQSENPCKCILIYPCPAEPRFILFWKLCRSRSDKAISLGSTGTLFYTLRSNKKNTCVLGNQTLPKFTGKPRIFFLEICYTFKKSKHSTSELLRSPIFLPLLLNLIRGLQVGNPHTKC